MASINKYVGKRGTTYRVMWRLPDGTQRSKTVKSREAAKALRVEVEALEQAGRTPDPQRGAIELSAWSEEFLGTLSLKPKSVAAYRSLLRSRILPEFGNTTLSNITRLSVQQWVVSMGEEVSPKRVRSAYALLNQMLKEAVRHDRLLTNPAEGVRLPTVTKRQVQVLTPAELRTVASNCGRYEGLVLFLGVMGCRWSEAIGLTWDKVQDGVVTIDSSLSETNGKFTRGSTKNNEVRRLPLPPSIANELPERPERPSDALVFTTTQGNPIRSARFRAEVWLPALTKAGVQRIKIHDLRHTAASVLISKGASIVLVSRWLGHADPSMTLNTYSHLYPNDLDDLARRIGDDFA